MEEIVGPTQVIVGEVNMYMLVPPAGTNFSWEVVGGEIQTPQGLPNVNVLWTVAGPGSVQVRATDPVGAEIFIVVDTQAGTLN